MKPYWNHEMNIMPTITLKNIPDTLYLSLKESAAQHRRSLNSEILFCMEEILMPRKLTVEEQLSTAQFLRAKTSSMKMGAEEITVAKTEGRL